MRSFIRIQMLKASFSQIKIFDVPIALKRIGVPIID